MLTTQGSLCVIEEFEQQTAEGRRRLRMFIEPFFGLSYDRIIVPLSVGNVYLGIKA